jgi:surfactin synthase thioesterase subunit
MAGSSTQGPEIVRLKPNPRARLRLFCFPYAGGGSMVFRTWAADLPSQIEVCSVRLPGREGLLREPPVTELAGIVQALALALQPLIGSPYAFFGHSMGALISFELTRRLRRQGDRMPEHLFIAAHRAPQLPDPHPPIHQLASPEFVEQLRRLKGTPEAVLQHAELMELMLPALRADFAVCETYVYTAEPPLSCPISAFAGLEDWKANLAELGAWREQTVNTFTLHTFPGDHFFLSSARLALLRAIAQDLRVVLSCLDETSPL